MEGLSRYNELNLPDTFKTKSSECGRLPSPVFTVDKRSTQNNLVFNQKQMTIGERDWLQVPVGYKWDLGIQQPEKVNIPTSVNQLFGLLLCTEVHLYFLINC